jgi:trans-aconitate methyltransferase
MGSRTSELYDKSRSVDFYEERYEQGYMDEWPAERKRRLIEVIRELPLPAHGDALDFGCGNGVLTEVVRQALPGGNVWGTDLSATAVQNARSRYPRCEFIEAGNIDRKFDLVFTHHVLEHVFDLEAVMGEITAHLNPECAMLHILPCGNEGSFERGVCLLRQDGINEKLEGRFFYEDEGHVRRLTTERLAAVCSAHGFELAREYYANQRDGAIEWITNSKPSFVRRFTDPSQAVDGQAARGLRRMRRKLALIAALRLPARLLHEVVSNPRSRRPKHLLALALSAPMLPVCITVDRYWKRRAAREWEQHRSERGGSAMTLFFLRTA